MKHALRFGFAALLAIGVSFQTQAKSPIRHVFLIVLENESAGVTFGPRSPAPYLARTLPKKGLFLPNYYATGHASLDNYIAIVSGQAPNFETQGDCPVFTDFAGTVGADGQAVGHGCVYPAAVKTLADQLAAAGFTWKSYNEDMGNDPARESAACGHAKLGEKDGTQRAQAASGNLPADQYAARHNPFVYFHSVIDSPACNTNVVNFSGLANDLSAAASTPNFSFITPNLCNDGHDGGRPGRACVTGESGGLVSADSFLQKWIPVILSSPAYKSDGLLIVTFDEADLDIDRNPTTNSISVTGGDTHACCHEPPGPNIAPDQIVFGTKDSGPGIIGPGGGRIGALLLSPRIKPGTRSNVAYNHYALLKTIETIFGLPYLGYAAQPGLKAIAIP